MTATRSDKIESYGQGYETLVEGLKKYPREMWDFKPSPKDWSVREILCHIADSEANSYVRCRRFIAEPGSGVYGYDTDMWSAGLNYQGQDADEAIELFGALRRNSYHLIRNLPDNIWSNTVEHSESGTMGMEAWLDIYERHVREHLAQMDDVYAAWKTTRAAR